MIRINFLNEASYKLINILIIPLFTGIIIFIIVFESIMQNKRKKQSEMLEKMIVKLDTITKKDYLTGIPNRNEFFNSLNELIERNMPCAVAFIDIDNFKAINDIYGHHQGDEVLKEVAKRLQKFYTTSSSVYRFGGDEFLILFKTNEKEQISKIMDELTSHEFTCKDKASDNISFTFSAGVALYPQDGNSSSVLLDSADEAMYHVKDHGRNAYEYHNSHSLFEYRNASIIQNEIKNAINENRIRMVFQPQLDLRKDKIAGFEALMRIDGCSFGPDQFIPVAETCGLMNVLGRIAFDQSIDFIIKIKELGIPLPIVSINYSAVQVSDTSFCDYIDKRLKECDIPYNKIEFELTETILFKDNPNFDKFIEWIKFHNMYLAMDDFGSGYSSISCITKFPFSIIKVDRTLLNTYLENNTLKLIIEFIHGCDTYVLTEGVETKEQYDFLLSNKCDFIQGYYFSRPLNFNDAVTFLNNYYRKRILEGSKW